MGICWSSGSNMSATIPRVTEPPAEQRPPKRRAVNTWCQEVLAPASICHMLTVNSDACMIDQRPNSSDHGAVRLLVLFVRNDVIRLLTPQFASKAIQNQEPSHSSSGVSEVVTSEIVMGVETPNGIRVHRCIVIWNILVRADSTCCRGVSWPTHAGLAQSHNSENLPLLFRRECVASLLDTVCFCKLEMDIDFRFGTSCRDHFDIILRLLAASWVARPRVAFVPNVQGHDLCVVLFSTVYNVQNLRRLDRMWR